MSTRDSLLVIEAGLQAVLTGLREIIAAQSPAPAPAPDPKPDPTPDPGPGPTPAPPPPIDPPIDPPTEPPAPVPPPPQPPAEPPPVGTFRVVTNGHTVAPQIPPVTDDIDLSKGFAPVPWSTYRDDKQTIARPLGGAEPVEWRCLTVYGCAAEYGIYTPAFVDGGIRMLYPSSVADDNPNELIVPELHRWPARGGPRGTAITTPYWVVRGHTRMVDGAVDTNPRIPMWVGVDMVGRVYYLMRDGSVDLVAQVPCKTYVNDFSYFDHERKVMWLTDTAAGEILHVRRNGRTFTPTVWAKVPGRATSVRAIGTKLYVANESHVIEIDALDNTLPHRQVCALPGVFWVDYKSTGELVVMTRNANVHVVDPASGAIGPDLNIGLYSSPGPIGWVMVDVDRNGTCGPRDSIYCVASHNQAINGSWRIDPAGHISRMDGIGGGGRSLSGVTTKGIEGGHYMWLTAIHPDEGLQMMQGGAQILPRVWAAVGAADPWPAEEPYDVGLCGLGFDISRTGGDMPFFAVMGQAFNTMLGLIPDHIAAMPVADAVRYVRGGLLSIHPRTLTDEQVRGFLYWTYRGSQQFQARGRPVIDKLFADFAALK